MNRAEIFRRVAGVLVTAVLVTGGMPGSVQAAFAVSETVPGNWIHDRDGRWFHQSVPGQRDRGWFRDADGGWYQLGTDGAMLAGSWFQDGDGSWYYLNVDGRMLAGQWFQDGDGGWYYLGASGAMMKGCVTPDGYTLLESGAWDVSVPRRAAMPVTTAAGSGTEQFSGAASSGGGGSSAGGSGSGGNNGVGSSAGGSSGGNSGGENSGEESSAEGSGSQENSGSNSAEEGGNMGSGADTGSTDIAATPSDAVEDMVSWQVHFTDRETHQISLAPPLSGTMRDGEKLVVNFRRRIIDSGNRIWETREEAPVTLTVYGPGNWLHYIEYEQTGTLPDKENPDKEEEKRLVGWYQTAKEAEAEITGEEPGNIPNSRFLVETGHENDIRLLTIADQIPVLEEPLVYVIGKNMVPNGIILEKRFCDELEYSHMVEDTIRIGADIFYVTRFTIRRKIGAETCHHMFEEEIHSEPTCLRRGRTVYTCALCGFQEEVIAAALGHADVEGDSVCDRCGGDVNDTDGSEAEKVHWNIGDVQAREIDGEIYLFRCIDQNYADGMETHRKSALFLCDSVIPANFGSEYCRKPDADGLYDYQFIPGPIVNFGAESDYKYSAIRTWLTDCEQNFFNTEPVNIGISRAYTGSTGAGMYSQFQESELTGAYIGSQRMSGKLFILSVDEAIRYKDWLWKFDGSESENPETQIGRFCKGYWLRTPEGAGGNHDTGRVYIVDLVNGNLHPCAVSPESGTADDELNVTGTAGVRPVFTMPQD